MNWHQPPALTPIAIPRHRRIRAAHAIAGIQRNGPRALKVRRDGTTKVSWRLSAREFWAWAWWRVVLWFCCGRHVTRIGRDEAARDLDRQWAHSHRWTVSPDCEDVAPEAGFNPFAPEAE